MKTIRVIKFTIPVCPKSVQHGSRFGRGRFYTDKKKAKYLDSIITEVAHHAPDKPWRGPVGVTMAFYMERAGWVKPSDDPQPCWQIRGTDDDNVYKGTKDAITKAGFWIDDSQVCESLLRMWWAEEALFPRIEVVVTLYEPPAGNIPPAVQKILKSTIQ